MPLTFDADRLVGKVDRSLILDVAKAVIETPSPTGYEEDMARLLVDVFGELGMDTHLQQIYEERFNAVGSDRCGAGSGHTILLSGHMDTSVRGSQDPEASPGFRDVATLIDDEWLYGNGIFNMKNAFACYVAAIDALKRSGLPLNGRLIVAGTAGEIESAAVDEFQGRQYDSNGMGLRYLISHGYAADHHILGEPSGMVPLTGQMGSTWVKVTTTGTFAHTAFADRQVNAISEMTRLQAALEPWIAKFRADNVFMGVTPQINQAAIRGGLPWRAARTPDSCSLYIDVRFPPTKSPIEVQREIRQAIETAADGLLAKPVKVDFYVSRPGTVLGEETPIIAATKAAHERVLDEPMQPQFAPPFCTDAIDANRYGIPTVVYGAGGRPRTSTTAAGSSPLTNDLRGQEGEYVRVEDMVKTAQVYAVACASLLMQP